MTKKRLPRGAKLIDTQIAHGRNGRREGVGLYDLPPDPRKRYPAWSKDALERERDAALKNVGQFEALIADQQKLIDERNDQIKLCEERDRLIDEWETDRANSDFPSSNEADPGTKSRN